MKKLSLLFLLTALILNIAAAQTITITGTVKTGDGDPLHFAFVQDRQYKYAAYTDSLGNFSVTANPASKLKVSCRGFRDTLVNINNRTVIAIVLRPFVNIVASRSNIPATVNENSNINEATLRDQIMNRDVSVDVPGYTRQYKDRGGHTATLTSATVDMAQGAIFPVFTHKEATQGSRYLFNDWVHGYVVKTNDTIIQGPDLFFNYDKMGGSLLLSKDKHAAIEVYKEQIKSFTLVGDLNQQYTFTMAPEIDKTHYVQVIAAGNNYKIYKLTKTKFIAANYSTDGLASTGNNYDEYADDGTYYVISKGGPPVKISLKKKALKEAFSADQGKLNQYFQANNSNIDDNYLKDLGDYMNK